MGCFSIVNAVRAATPFGGFLTAVLPGFVGAVGVERPWLYVEDWDGAGGVHMLTSAGPEGLISILAGFLGLLPQCPSSIIHQLLLEKKRDVPCCCWSLDTLHPAFHPLPND